MPRPITLSQLRSISQSFELSTKRRITERKAQSIKVFISHSSRDRELVNDVVALLTSFGNVNPYIDSLDPELPQRTNGQTADLLRSKIKAHDRFLVVATESALGSRWVPWEIGFADSAKNHSSIALLALADPKGNFPGSEYLQLYQTIQNADTYTPFGSPPRPMVYTPASSNSISLESWLTGQRRFYG